MMVMEVVIKVVTRLSSNEATRAKGETQMQRTERILLIGRGTAFELRPVYRATKLLSSYILAGVFARVHTFANRN